MRESTQLKIFYHIFNTDSIDFIFDEYLSIIFIQFHDFENINIDFAQALSKIKEIDKSFRIRGLPIHGLNCLQCLCFIYRACNDNELQIGRVSKHWILTSAITEVEVNFILNLEYRKWKRLHNNSQTLLGMSYSKTLKL